MGRLIGRYLAGIVVVALVITTGLVVRTIQFSQPTTVSARADAIVVLGAAQYDGRPSPVFAARLDRAAGIFRNGLAPRIITVGAGQPGDSTTEAEAGRQYLAAAGIPDSALIAVPVGIDTLISLRAADQVLGRHGWSSVILVTDGWHMNRSRMMARDLGLQVQAAPVEKGPATDPDVRLRYLLRELAGVVFYRLIGGSSGSGSAVL